MPQRERKLCSVNTNNGAGDGDGEGAAEGAGTLRSLAWLLIISSRTETMR